VGFLVTSALTFCMMNAVAIIDRPTRHPFRASLPVYRAPKPVATPLSDKQLFVMTFIAGFMAFYGFLL
jgi:hypothetical protein